MEVHPSDYDALGELGLALLRVRGNAFDRMPHETLTTIVDNVVAETLRAVEINYELKERQIPADYKSGELATYYFGLVNVNDES